MSAVSGSEWWLFKIMTLITTDKATSTVQQRKNRPRSGTDSDVGGDLSANICKQKSRESRTMVPEIEVIQKVSELFCKMRFLAFLFTHKLNSKIFT